MRHLSTMYGCRSKSPISRRAKPRRDRPSWRPPSRQSTRARSCYPALQCRQHRLMIREGQDTIANDLTRLMALAGDQQDVAALEIRDCLADRFGAVADLGCASSVGKNGGADRRRVFAARVVVGHDDTIGTFSCDAAHDRPLAAIPIAACTEHHGELSLRVGTQACQRLLERVGLARIVDKDRRSVPVADEFETAFCPGELYAARKGARRIGAGGNSKPRRTGSV